MRKILKKMVLGDLKSRSYEPTHAIQKRIRNIKAIWNNDHNDDVGIEKIFRLFLSSSQFLFPGIYIKHLFGRWGTQIQYLGMDTYVLLKVIFPFIILYEQYSDFHFLTIIVLWLLIETILYVPALIFASDIIAKPSSYRRSILLLFFNYFEIVLAFAVIYGHGNYLNQPFKEWYDPIYFSFTTLGTIGFGDFYPVTGMGKLLVCSQSLIFLAFVVLFINFFSNRIESKGYFEHPTNEK